MSKQIKIVDKFDDIRKTAAKDDIFVEKLTTLNDEILIPKDPIEVLNELKPGVIIATEQLKTSQTVMASVKINENTYVEYGKTSSIAAQAVAESALKDLFFEQIKSTIFNDDDFQYNTNSWKLLGSLAMFKLIEEWFRFYMLNNKYKNTFEISISPKINESSNNLLSENQNSKTISKNDCTSKKQDSLCKNVKEDRIQKNTQPIIIKKDKAVNNIKKNSQKLLENKILFDDTNACCILNELIKSNFKFVDLQINKNQPPFKFSVIVDNVEYISDLAGSKKEAKQNVAKKVLIKKFGYRLKKE